MKQTVLKILSWSLKVLAVLGGGAAYMHMIPEKWGAIAVLVFGLASILKDTVNRIGDLLDDGKANQSFK